MYKIVLFCCFILLGGNQQIALDSNAISIEQQKRAIFFCKKALPEQKVHEEIDQALNEIYLSLDLLYQKMIEVTALSYCHDSKHAYDGLLIDLGSESLKLVKNLLLYLPKLYRAKHLSRIVKIKQVLCIATLITVLGLWVKKYWKQQVGSVKNDGYYLPGEYELGYRPRPRPSRI